LAIPESTTEIQIAEIWKQLLQRDEIGVDDDFFEKGGDSLLAVAMLLEIEALTGKHVPEETLFEAATIRHLMRSVVEAHRREPKLIIELQAGSELPPFFYFHGDLVGDGSYSRELVRRLGPEQPFYALPPDGLWQPRAAPTIEEMAQVRVAAIRAARPHGPYRLGGYCNGALVAYEAARQLVAAGERVDAVVMIDPLSFNARPTLRFLHRLVRQGAAAFWREPDRRALGAARTMASLWRFLIIVDAYFERGHRFLLLPRHVRRTKLGQKLKRLVHEGARWWTSTLRSGSSASGLTLTQSQPSIEDDDPVTRWNSELWRSTLRAMASYVPVPSPARVICYVGNMNHGFKFAGAPWKRVSADIDVIAIEGAHATCVTTELAGLTARLRRDLGAVPVNAG
jgi:thioesterase domain-containing protein/acyl carrier protein